MQILLQSPEPLPVTPVNKMEEKELPCSMGRAEPPEPQHGAEAWSVCVLERSADYTMKQEMRNSVSFAA